MKARPFSPCLSPLHASAIIFKEMFDRDYAVTGATNSTPAGRTEFDDSAPALSPTKNTPPLSRRQAFANRSTKPVSSLRSTARERRPRSQQVSVLVVDDVHDVTEMIALFLKHAGYEVATADSASAALRLAEKRRFDLIISDIGMPEMNGYELAGALRRLSEYQSIPMIAVTGYTEYDDRGRALQAGFSAHLTKPINPSQLLDLMNGLLG